MKYTNEVVIDLPRGRVVELFDEPKHLPKWQPGLVLYEPISGEPGQVGAKARLKFDTKRRQIEMVETVTERNLPEMIAGTYETDGVLNIMVNRFHEVGPNQTRWVAENEFQFSGFMAIMALFMGGAFKKQSQEYMDLFKVFAEGEGK